MFRSLTYSENNLLNKTSFPSSTRLTLSYFRWLAINILFLSFSSNFLIFIILLLKTYKNNNFSSFAFFSFQTKNKYFPKTFYFHNIIIIIVENNSSSIKLRFPLLHPTSRTLFCWSDDPLEAGTLLELNIYCQIGPFFSFHTQNKCITIKGKQN